MRIGLDLDGLFFNQEKFQFKNGIPWFKNKYIKEYYEEYGVKLKKSDVQVLDLATGKAFNNKKEIDFNKPYIEMNSKGYGIKEVFNCSDEEQKKFWYKHMLGYALFVPFRAEAVRVAKQLHHEGKELYIISSRAKANENNIIGKIQRGIVIFRFKTRGIPYKKAIFCPYEEGQEIEAKVQACDDNGIDLMIEDKKGTAVAVEKRTKAKSFLFASRNNDDMKNKDIPRFVNFDDLYIGIRKFEEKEKFQVLHREEKEKMTPLERENYYREYRNYLMTHNYNEEIIRKREKRMKRVVKFGKLIFDRFVKYEVINTDRIPEKGGVITVNHRDMLDIPTIMSAIGPRPYHPMLKSEFLETKAEKFLTKIDCLFVNRNDKTIRELSRENAIIRVLMGGYVIVCPEGTRNKTDKILLDFDHGAVSISQTSGELIYPSTIYRGRSCRIINFGEPIEVGPHTNLEEANKILYNRKLELLEESRKHDEEEQEKLNSGVKVKKLLRKMV